jgi:hypothetical protein
MASSPAGTGEIAIVILRFVKEPVELKRHQDNQESSRRSVWLSKTPFLDEWPGMSTKSVNVADRCRYGPEMPYVMGRPTSGTNNRLANTACQTLHLVESNRDIMCRAVCRTDSRIVTVTARDRPQHRSPRLDPGAVRRGKLTSRSPTCHGRAPSAPRPE